MIRAFKLTAIAAFIVVGAVPSRASTNIVQNVTFQLVAYEQGATNHPSTNLTVVAVNTLKISTKDVIALLGTATTNNFSSKARLVRVTKINGSSNIEAFEVRDGTNAVDVSGFFPGSGRFDDVRQFTYNSKTQIGTGVIHSLFRLVITNIPPAFLTANGFAVTTLASVTSGKTVLAVDTVSADIAGTGADTSGVPFISSGTVTILGHTTEIK